MSLLTNAEFRCLYKELENRLKEAYKATTDPFPQKREEIIGYHGVNCLSIFSLMTGNEKIRSMAGTKTLSPKYLYNRLLEQEEGAAVDLNKTYETAYYMVCGCETKEEFFLRHPVIKKTCTYDVLYFSKNKHLQETQICSLEMQIFFDDTVEAAIWGFHKKFDQRLKGSVRLRGDCWRIFTEWKDWFLEITIHIGTTGIRKTGELLDVPFLKGLLHGVTAYDYPISMECVLIKNDIPHLEEASLKIKRYLNLLRNTFNVRLENIQQMKSVDHLQIEGIDLARIGYIANKTYRILTYNPIEAVIAQSWFTIEDDFTGWILVPPKSEKLHCLLSIANGQLVVQALDPIDHRLSTYTIIEIAPERDLLIHGVFCRIRGSYKPVGGFFVMAAEEIAPDPLPVAPPDPSPGTEPAAKDQPARTAEEYSKKDLEASRPPDNILFLLRELYTVNGLDIPALWQ